MNLFACFFSPSNKRITWETNFEKLLCTHDDRDMCNDPMLNVWSLWSIFPRANIAKGYLWQKKIHKLLKFRNFDLLILEKAILFRPINLLLLKISTFHIRVNHSSVQLLFFPSFIHPLSVFFSSQITMEWWLG